VPRADGEGRVPLLLQDTWHETRRRRDAAVVARKARCALGDVARTAPAPPAGLCEHLHRTLPPDGAEGDDRCAEWLDRSGLALGQLNREFLATVDTRLCLGDAGQPLAAATAGRYRKVARACIRRAVELDILAADPWPPVQRGRSKRKVVRARRSFDLRTLPDPATMRRALAAV